MNDYKTIGTSAICNINELAEWLESDYGHNYLIYNWSPANQEYWNKGEKINFYNLQQVIPGFLQIDDFYRNLNHWKISSLIEEYEYMQVIQQKYDLLYLTDNFAVIRNANKVYLFPEKFLINERFCDYDHISISKLKVLKGTSELPGLIPASKSNVTMHDMKSLMDEKHREIAAAEEQIENLQKEKEAELQKLKEEIEKAYQDKFKILELKMSEMTEIKNKLKQQLFILDSEIYAIRCYTGEIIQFTQLAKGNYSDKTMPVVIYQKIRYLDEEMGKWLSLYDFDGNDEKYFESILSNRKDMQNLFAPGNKSVSLVKVSRTGTIYCPSDNIANVLSTYSKYHGDTIGIIVRDGENIWIGWTDEERVSLYDDKVFYNNKKEIIDPDDELHISTSTTKEMVSRYFIYALLQGMVDAGKMIRVPEKVLLLKSSPYIFLSMADGWLEDNKFGTFEEIVSRTSLPLHKGDMVLTTMHITRDDIYERNSIYETFNNDRGRGEKNRTYDVSLNNCTIYPINVVDQIDYYDIYAKVYPYRVTEHKKKTGTFPQSWSINYTYEEQAGPPALERYQIKVINNEIKGLSLKMYSFNKIMDLIGDKYFGLGQVHQRNMGNKQKAILEIYYSSELIETEYKYFISGKKRNSNTNANFEILANEECLNLTFLNSVWVKYAIINRNMGSWKIGNKTVDYAKSIKYLNTALQYLNKREVEEAAMLKKYMDLYSEWQVDLSEWKIKNKFHRLTDARAKKFSKEVTK